MAAAKQLNLWDRPPEPVALNVTVAESEAPRLGAKHAAIIEAFEAAPGHCLTNLQLTTVGGLRFGARLAELRAAGHDIVTGATEPKSGIVTYTYRELSHP